MADVPSNVDPMTKKFLGKEMYLVVTRPVRSPEIASGSPITGTPGGARAARHHVRRRTALFARLQTAGSRDVRPARQLVRGGRSDRQGGPVHAAGLRTFTLQKWRVNEGSITVKIDTPTRP